MATPPPPVTSVTGTIATTSTASTAVNNTAPARADDYPFYRHRLSLNGHDGMNAFVAGGGYGGGGRGVSSVCGVTPDRRPSHQQDAAATAPSTMRTYFPLPPLSVSQQSLQQRHPQHHAHHTPLHHHHHHQHQTHCGGGGGGDWSVSGGGDGSGCSGGGYGGDVSGAVSTVAATTASLHSCGGDFGSSVHDPLSAPDGQQRRCTDGSASRDIDRIDAAGRQHLMGKWMCAVCESAAVACAAAVSVVQTLYCTGEFGRVVV